MLFSVVLILIWTALSQTPLTPILLAGDQLLINLQSLSTAIDVINIIYYSATQYSVIGHLRSIQGSSDKPNNDDQYIYFNGINANPNQNVSQVNLTSDGTFINSTNSNNFSTFLLNTTTQSGNSFNTYVAYLNYTQSGALTKNKLYIIDFYYTSNVSWLGPLTTAEQVLTTYFHTFGTSTSNQVLLPRNRKRIDQFSVRVSGYSINITAVSSMKITINLFTSNLLFKGQVYYIFAYIATFLPFDINNQQLDWAKIGNYPINASYWAGLTFSKSHVDRDMIVWQVIPNGTISINDAYSIYAMSPFYDTSFNIQSTNDIKDIASASYGNFSIGYMLRLFDTGDAISDEVIKDKLNNNHCFAFQMSNINSNNTINQNPKHNFIYCYTPNLSLWSQHVFITFISLIALLAIF